MLFKKNRNKMVDIRELQKRGVVRIPSKKINTPKTSEGFVEIKPTKQTENPQQSKVSNSDFFGFMDTSKTTTSNPQNFSEESNGHNKREVDSKITNLDNKVYKLEQRIELLEKKLDITQPTNNTGAMGW